MNSQQVRYASARVQGAAEQVRQQAREKYTKQPLWNDCNKRQLIVLDALVKGKLKLASPEKIVAALRKERYERDVEAFIDEGQLATFITGWDNSARAANKKLEDALQKVDKLEREILDEIQLGDAADCLERIKELEALVSSI